MILNGATLAAVNRSFRAWFTETLEKDAKFYVDMVNMLAMNIASTAADETYDWLGAVPQMVEWKDQRILQGLRNQSYRLVNKDWSNGIKMHANTIKDDKLGLIKPKIMMLATEAIRHKYDNLMTVLNAGTAAACYDGQYFFSSSHSEGDSGTQDNYTDALLDADSYAAARVALMGFKNDRGRKMGVFPTHLFVCPELEGTGKEILEASHEAAGASNIWMGTCKLVVAPDLDIGGNANGKSWAVLDLGKFFKPLIQQNREDVSFTAMDAPTDESVFNTNEFRYGAQYRGAAGYGFWQLAYASDGTGS